MKQRILQKHVKRLQRWVAALRSKKFIQGEDMLKDTTGTEVKHCCLGVGCEVRKKSDGKKFKGTGQFLPKGTAEWFGVDDNPIVSFEFRDRSLTDLNDTEHLSFDAIADLIEGEFITPNLKKKDKKKK